MKLLDHFTVYSCIGCGSVLKGRNVLCDECRIKLKAETALRCPDCKAPHHACTCAPEGGLFAHAIHLAPYLEYGVARNIVLGCKKIKNKALFDLVADFMAHEMVNRLPIEEQTLLIGVPRSAHSKRNYGFDQTEQVLTRIAARLQLNDVPALRHKGRKMQKSLGMAERVENANDAFSLLPKYQDFIAGRPVILYDDLVASGATVCACARLLKAAGAQQIELASFARRPKAIQKSSK